MNPPSILTPFLALACAALLSACAGGGGQQPGSVFTDDNVYGPSLPGGATVLPPDEFEARVKDGTLTLDTAKDRAALQAKQDAREAEDRALLNGLPNKSPALESMLAAKPGLRTGTGGDYLAEVTLQDGTAKTVSTLGEAEDFRMFVAAFQGSSDHDTLASVYAQAYQALTPAQQGSYAAPSAEAARSASQIKADLASVNSTLEATA
ncbi:MAG TPA: hypothetical protein VHN99_00120, partial [Deinococcales bacterium]|nr:hypothetical protein [Deinococcales bacterium]